MDSDQWDEMQRILPANWRELAVSTGATKGLRQDKEPGVLLRTLLLHLGCGYSLRTTAAKVQQADLAKLSAVALHKRLKKCGPWLQQLCVALYQERGATLDDATMPAFRLVDATLIKEPGATGSQWRVHFSFKLPDLRCDYFHLTGVQGVGTGESLRQFAVQRGDHLMGDRGYCTAAGIHHVHSQGATITVRVNVHALPLETPDGKAFKPIDVLRPLTQEGAMGEWPVVVRGPHGEPVVGRFIAQRKDEHNVHRTRQRLKRQASKNQQRLQEETLLVNEFILLFTTLPASIATAKQVLAWYRVRWQVELLFKRAKSLAGLGHLPKKDPTSSHAWIHGKLLLALLTDKLARYAGALSPYRDDEEDTGAPADTTYP